MAVGMRHIPPSLEGDNRGLPMRNRDSKTQRDGAATKPGAATKHRGAAGSFAVTLTLALAVALSAGSAFAADDEEEVPLDTKLFRQWMKDLGLQRDGEAIEYRERAPLVVPPSRNLPPPRSGEAAVTSNPAWPNDPDAKQRKAAAVKKKQPNRTAAEAADAEARPLSRTELERGRTAAGTQSGGTVTKDADAESSRPLRPTELGSKSLFSNMFSSAPWADKTEVGTFTSEPTRDNLTAPPPGYQTPSPNQPYGLGPQNEKRKGLTLEDRTAGETR
jgi:hypothetical protein